MVSLHFVMSASNLFEWLYRLMRICCNLFCVISEFSSAILTLIPLFSCLDSLLDELSIRFPAYRANSGVCVLQRFVQFQVFDNLRWKLVNLISVQRWYNRLKVSICHLYRPSDLWWHYYSIYPVPKISLSPSFPTNAYFKYSNYIHHVCIQHKPLKSIPFVLSFRKTKN